MMRICNLNERSLSISLHNINKCNTLSRNTNKINILNKKTPSAKGGWEFKFEDKKKEEDLAEEEAKSYVVIVGRRDILTEIVKVL